MSTCQIIIHVLNILIKDRYWIGKYNTHFTILHYGDIAKCEHVGSSCILEVSVLLIILVFCVMCFLLLLFFWACFSFCVMRLMLPVSLDCPFVVALTFIWTTMLILWYCVYFLALYTTSILPNHLISSIQLYFASSFFVLIDKLCSVKNGWII